MPIKTNGYSHRKADQRQNQKRYEADNRQAKYDSLTIAEKFSTLVEGGSKKQRAKLTKQLESAAKKGIPKVQPTEVPTTPSVETKPVKKVKKPRAKKS
jgi:hypothetical protein